MPLEAPVTNPTLPSSMKNEYARVSSQDHNLAMQNDALKTAKCTRIYHEKRSGKDKERPERTDAPPKLLVSHSEPPSTRELSKRNWQTTTRGRPSFVIS